MRNINLSKAVFVRPLLFLVLLSGFQASSAQAQAVRYNINFQIKNMGINVDGAFSEVQGNFEFNPDQYRKGSIQVQIPVASLNTGNKLRDRHLRSDDYFDAARWPYIHFKSDSIRPFASAGQWVLYGSLRIKEVEKKIAIPFKLHTNKEGQFEAEGALTINRRDYGVGGRSLILSDQVKARIQVVFP